jgi:cytoskeletal protein CcmA (bactofilin family)
MGEEEVKLSVVDEEEVDTVLGSEIEFEGDIESSKSLMIKGKISGSIRCGAELYITEQAEVHSNIHAATVVIRGKVYGDISADSLIAVLDWGHVEGSLSAPDIYLSPDCFFKGTTVFTP